MSVTLEANAQEMKQIGIRVVYIAGPMTGVVDFNRPAFNSMAAILHYHGLAAINPADNFNRALWLAYPDYMRMALHNLLVADAVVALDQWEHSRGAAFEVKVARMLNLLVFDAHLNLIEAET